MGVVPLCGGNWGNIVRYKAYDYYGKNKNTSSKKKNKSANNNQSTKKKNKNKNEKHFNQNNHKENNLKKSEISIDNFIKKEYTKVNLGNMKRINMRLNMKSLEEIKARFTDIEINDKYLEVFDILKNTNDNVSVIAEAGAGKSTLLKVLNYAIEDNVVICASTGVASALLSASSSDLYSTTIHSTFKIKPQTIYSTSTFHKVDVETKAVIENMDVLIIDECSMINASLFDYLIGFMKYIRRGTLPRIILFSDICQLPPVVNNDEVITKYFKTQYNGNIYFFNSHAYEDENFHTIFFEKIYRQIGDDTFKNILNRIRVGKFTNDDLTLLNERVLKDEDEEINWELDNETSIRICSTNKEVDTYNKIKMDSLTSDEYVFKANMTESFKYTDKFKSGLYPEEIRVKIGCPIMITHNDVGNNRMFVNGSMGILTACDVENRKCTVRLNSGIEVEVGEYETQEFEYNVNYDENNHAEITAKPKASYSNVAIKPCSSLTIHKTQGLTIDKAIVSFGNWIPEDGVYVALSRMRSLNDFKLVKPLRPTDIKVNKEALDFLKRESSKEKKSTKNVEEEKTETNANLTKQINDILINLSEEQRKKVLEYLKTL